MWKNKIFNIKNTLVKPFTDLKNNLFYCCGKLKLYVSGNDVMCYECFQPINSITTHLYLLRITCYTVDKGKILLWFLYFVKMCKRNGSK